MRWTSRRSRRWRRTAGASRWVPEQGAIWVPEQRAAIACFYSSSYATSEYFRPLQLLSSHPPHPPCLPHALHQIIWRPSVEILKEEGIEVEVTTAEEEEEREDDDGSEAVSSAVDTSSLVVVHESGVK